MNNPIWFSCKRKNSPNKVIYCRKGHTTPDGKIRVYLSDGSYFCATVSQEEAKEQLVLEKPLDDKTSSEIESRYQFELHR
jgi:hypothetical protein